MDVDPVQLLPRIEKRQLDESGDAHDTRLERGNQRSCRGCGAAGGEDVIDHENVIRGRHSVVVDFDSVRTVFENVFVTARGPRKFSRLADRDESCSKNPSDTSAEDEPTRLNAGDNRHAGVGERFGEALDGLLECLRRAEKGSDVFEADTRFGEVADLANVFLEVVGDSHQNFTSKSPSRPVKSLVSWSIRVTSA